jgi:outer membrane protein TolC
MERLTWAWMLAGALLLSGVGTAPCAAQPPDAPSPAVNPETTQGGHRPPSLLPPSMAPAPGEGVSPTARSPLDTGATLPTPTPLPNDVRFPINLATALRLSDARPLIVASAQASVWVAEADLTQAKVLWIPTLNIGFDYIRHDGGGPDFNKGILTAVSTNFFYAGGGLTGPALGAISTTDAIYQPLVARQVLNSRQWDIQSAKNDAVLRTADAYFLVHQYRGMYAGLLYCVERGQDLVERIATLSRDLVPEVEVERARNMLADIQQRTVMARQQWRVQSANLTQILRLEPRAVVEPLEHDHVQITLIDPGRSLQELMSVALANRPELSSRLALVAAAEAAVRREKARPFIPSIVLNGFQTPLEQLQAGIFGFGANNSMNQWTGRDDVSVQPLWQLQNIGFGNLAMIKRQRGQQSQAIIDLFRAQDMVAADVTRALARLQSAAARVFLADRALRTGIITVNGNFEGLKQISRFGDVLVLVNRPQEAVYALQLLNKAFDEYFTTVAEYNRAQFELFHALGYPAREITYLRPPGNIQPVDTARPAFLPPVGNGPPPATR